MPSINFEQSVKSTVTKGCLRVNRHGGVIIDQMRKDKLATAIRNQFGETLQNDPHEK